MEYEDLPMHYRTFAEESGWEENRALAYWKAAEPYRDAIEKSLLEFMKGFAGTGDGVAFGALNHTLFMVRGKRAELV